MNFPIRKKMDGRKIIMLVFFDAVKLGYCIFGIKKFNQLLKKNSRLKIIMKPLFIKRNNKATLDKLKMSSNHLNVK